jgi:hypothetical protein
LQQISIPFQTPLVTAEDLINDMTADGATVVSVARYLTSTDALEVYTGVTGIPFPLSSGMGYQVQVSTGATYTPTYQLVFDGFVNTPLGQAELAIVDNELVVSNIGASGEDGFRVDNPGFGGFAGSSSSFKRKAAENDDFQILSSHEDWEEMGIYATRDIDPGAPLGSSIEATSLVTLEPIVALAQGGGSSQITVTLTKTAPGITILPDFSAAGSTTYTYSVFNGAIMTDTVSGQSAAVLAADWPVRNAFSEYSWDGAVTITLPGSTPVVGDRLEILPESPTMMIMDVEALEVRLASIPVLQVGQESLATCGNAGPGNPCDDGDACTVGETCSPEGSCVGGTPANCDDGISCTVDTCQASLGCQSTPNNTLCSDGIGCTIDTCSEVSGCQSTPSNGLCNDGIGCTTDTCVALVGCQNAPNNTLCNDGLFCNGIESCSASFGCQSGSPVVCNDGNACTADSCDEASDSCEVMFICELQAPATSRTGKVMLTLAMLGVMTWLIRRRLG